MNRKMAIVALNIMANRYAERYKLNIETRRNASNGLWDSTEFTGCSKTFTQVLIEKYGKLEEVHFTDVPFDTYDLRKDFKVSFEYRFGEPKICIGTQWGEGGFACLELYNAGKKDGKEDYRISELMCFKESGFHLMKMLKRDFDSVCKELGVCCQKCGGYDGKNNKEVSF